MIQIGYRKERTGIEESITATANATVIYYIDGSKVEILRTIEDKLSKYG
jgi:hypothetical protein